MNSAFTDPNQNHSRQVQSLLAKLIQEINKRMLAGVSDDDILDFAFDALALLIPYDRIGIAILNPLAETLQLTWVRSKVPIQNLRQYYSAPIDGSSLKKILEAGEPRIINDLNKYLQEHPQSKNTQLLLKDGIQSNLTCPLRANGKPIGVVFFSSTKLSTYNAEHREIFSNIADELSIVIEHGRLRSHVENSLSKTLSMRMMLHDLKTPLSVILLSLDGFSNQDWYKNLSGEGREIFSLLHRNAAYMRGLLNELTELIQIESGTQVLDIENVNLKEFFNDMLVYGKLLAEKKEIRFINRLDPNLPEFFRFDPIQIRRALDNLFTNAIKFSQRNTQVTFQAHCQNRRLSFTVIDQGPGIPASEISRLFHEFGRTSVRPTEGERSTGLGLAIAKGIVERHGGQISVSSHLGIGSTFTFWLPWRD